MPKGSRNEEHEVFGRKFVTGSWGVCVSQGSLWRKSGAERT